MRNSLNPNDDIWSALECNSPSHFHVEEVESIEAEVPGANDELSWWWILQLTNDRYILVAGWCDYTGWGCQSGITEHEIVNTALAAAQMAPEFEDFSKREIKRNLVNQILGEQPFGTEITIRKVGYIE
jgi:hypothetical protein